MIENFIEYMWYLLTTPLKKLKKALNKWYILCRVFGKRFDEAKEDILRARDEGMVATCSHEMLPVHGADRRLTRYEGEHPEKLLMKQRYRMQPCEEAYSIRKTLEQYRMVIDYFDYLKLNGLWKLTGSRLMDAQRTEYTTKQAYSFGVEHTREFRVIWHEEHNLIFLDGTWSLDGSKIIDAWQKTEVL